MNRARSLAAGLLLVLGCAVAACQVPASPSTGSASAPTAGSSGSESPAVAPGAATGLSSSATPGSTAGQPAPEQVSTPDAPPPAVASSDPLRGGAVSTDAAGRPVKSLGETARLSAPDDASVTEFSLRVESVQRLAGCQIRGIGGRGEPERRVFLKLRLTATLAPGAGGVDGFMPLTAGSFFTAPSASSTGRESADSEAAFGCDDPTRVPVAVDAGGTERGTLILDAAHEHGLLIYEPPGTGGWSWRY